MDLKYLKEVMQLFEKSSLCRLTIKEKHGVEITVEKEIEAKEPLKHAVKRSPPPAYSSDPPPAKTTADKLEAQVEPSKCIKSPMVGTFYRAPSPEETPYAVEGATVKSGQTLCIVEAMKVMNEITSEHSGKIKEILVGDGEPVEFGQILFVLE